MFTPGPMELCMIGGIAVLLFGHKLPKVARSIGSSIVEFKKGVEGVQEPIKELNETIRDVQK